MTDKKAFKVSAKKYVFLIISCVLIIAGLTVGTIMHCLNGTFFNYSGEFGNYNSVVINYNVAEDKDGSKSQEVAESILSGYTRVTKSENNRGGEVVYIFSANADTEELTKLASQIETKLHETGLTKFTAVAHHGQGTVGGGRSLMYAAIAAASVVALEMVYCAIRYKLSSLISVLLAQAHNLALFTALVALLRIPVGTDMISIALAVVFLTAMLTCILFAGVRMQEKSAENANPVEATNQAARSNFKLLTIVSACLAGVMLICYAVLSIVTMNALAAMPFVVAIFGVLVCYYAIVTFIPAFHSVFAGLLDNKKFIKKKKKADK